uniref:Coiled-coil-helix-coiled-coil-helix domain containing 1 n=1 Tax=Oncorhynchus mykiss TaxID=8022 RepID=A0A8C7Q569_ONCMY
MAMQGGTALQEKVSRMLSRKHKKPVLKPNKPLVLKDEVANRKIKKGEATCVTEMSMMMACWKQNNFVDTLCSNEMQSFYTCVEKAQVCCCYSVYRKSLLQAYCTHPSLPVVLN